MGGSWDKPSKDCEAGKSQWLAKGNLEEMPHESNSNYHKGTTQQLRDSLWVCLCLFTGNVFFLILINTLLASLLSVFVAILFCKAEASGPLTLTTGLVPRTWCFYHRDPAHLWLGTQALFQVVAAGGHPRSVRELRSCKLPCMPPPQKKYN